MAGCYIWIVYLAPDCSQATMPRLWSAAASAAAVLRLLPAGSSVQQRQVPGRRWPPQVLVPTLLPLPCVLLYACRWQGAGPRVRAWRLAAGGLPAAGATREGRPCAGGGHTGRSRGCVYSIRLLEHGAYIWVLQHTQSLKRACAFFLRSSSSGSPPTWRLS